MPSELELNLSQIKGIEGLDQRREIARPGQATQGNFTEALGKAIGEVDRMQVASDQQASMVAQGQGNLHEMAIALEKADVSMRLAMKVRNKVVEAYNEIMRMGV